MDISLDRHLDDRKISLVTMTLRSRSTEMHSVLSALDAAQKAAVQAALARAMDEIATVLRPVVASQPSRG